MRLVYSLLVITPRRPWLQTMHKSTLMINLVKDELEVTLSHAESRLRMFAEGVTETTLSECVEDFKQLAGTAKMIDLIAAELLAKELVLLTQFLQTRAADDAKMSRIMDGLMLGLTMLHRYFNYVKYIDQTLPELLLPTINDIRLIRGDIALPESLFFNFERENHVPELRSLVKKSSLIMPNEADLRRLRHMYQVGLLEIIRDNEGGFRLMKRALDRVETICGDTPAAEIWPLAQTAVEAMVMGNVALTRPRKLLFAWLDRELKLLSLNGRAYLESPPSADLVKELCYLIAISSEGCANIKTKKEVLKLNKHSHSDAALQLERDYMSGPDGSVVHAVCIAVGEELVRLKEIIDALCRGNVVDTNDDVIILLESVAQTLLVLEMNELSDEINDMIRHVKASPTHEVDTDKIKIYEPVIDLVLSVENQMATLLKAGRMAKATPHQTITKEKIPLSILDEVRLIVLNEARTALSVTKQALTSYMDSGWDVLHLNTVPRDLHSIWGALYFLRIDRAAAIIFQTEQCVQKRLLADKHVPPTENEIETLADVITGVDYYLESMVMDKPLGVGILEVAEEGLGLLGYSVKQ